MGDDANFVHLMNHQLALWANQAPAPAPAPSTAVGGAEEEGVLRPQEVLAVYRLLGSEPFPSNVWGGGAPDNAPGAGHGSLLSGLGWARGLAVLFWYCSCALASGPDGTPGMRATRSSAPLFPAPLQPLLQRSSVVLSLGHDIDRRASLLFPLQAT